MSIDRRGTSHPVKGLIRKLALAAHLLHARAYAEWQTRESGWRFRDRLRFEEQDFFLRLRPILQGADLVLYDVGAYIGTLSSCAAKLPSVAEVHSFEPIPSLFSKLLEELERYPHVHCHNVALGDANAERQMHVHKALPSSSLRRMLSTHVEEFPGTGESHLELVQVVRLDDYVREHNLSCPDVIKIDVQGFEDRVIAGGRATIQQARYCVLEMSLKPLYENSPVFDDIYQLMRAMSFRLMAIGDDIRGRSGNQLQVDGIFENEARCL